MTKQTSKCSHTLEVGIKAKCFICLNAAPRAPQEICTNTECDGPEIIPVQGDHVHSAPNKNNSPAPQSEGWEKEFDKKFDELVSWSGAFDNISGEKLWSPQNADIKSFIASLLTQAEERGGTKMLEAMKDDIAREAKEKVENEISQYEAGRTAALKEAIGIVEKEWDTWPFEKTEARLAMGNILSALTSLMNEGKKN